MTDANPIDLFFGGLRQLGPGSDADTLHVLRMLPKRSWKVVVDAGSGTGRQTLALANELGTPIDAVDNHQPFLDDLLRFAEAAGLRHLVRAHRLDMKDIPQAFPQIDLLWSEGAAYNLGFSEALKHWRKALAREGLLVVSELAWLKPVDQVPIAAAEFFRSAYPAMQQLGANVAAAEEAGYRILATHTLPPDAWRSGYYEALLPRALSLADHADPVVREFAAEALREVEVFEQSDGSYGYVFFVLEPAE